MGFILLMTVLALALIGAITAVTLQHMRSRTRSALTRDEHAELVSARLTLNEVKHTAYEHMALDSNLSHLIIERINKHERKALGK